MSEGETEKGRSKYLAVIHCEVQMVECMVCGTVDDLLERVSSDHVRVVDL